MLLDTWNSVATERNTVEIIDLFDAKVHPEWMRPPMPKAPATSLVVSTGLPLPTSGPAIHRDFFAMAPGTIFKIKDDSELFLRIAARNVNKVESNSSVRKWRNCINLTMLYNDALVFMDEMNTAASETPEVMQALAQPERLSKYEELRLVQIFLNMPEPPKYQNYAEFQSYGNAATTIAVDDIVAAGFSATFVEFIVEYISYMPQNLFIQPARTVWYGDGESHD